MAPTTLPSHFAEFSRLLNQEGAEYLLVGGWAVGLHGFARYTDDVDLWFYRARANAERVLRALRRFAVEDVPRAAETLLVERRIFRLAEPPRTMDLHNTLSGVDFETCHARRIIVVVGDIEIPVISREDLLINKRASKRLKDHADADVLEG